MTAHAVIPRHLYFCRFCGTDPAHETLSPAFLQVGEKGGKA